jgi:hypothetical protein
MKAFFCLGRKFVASWSSATCARLADWAILGLLAIRTGGASGSHLPLRAASHAKNTKRTSALCQPPQRAVVKYFPNTPCTCSLSRYTLARYRKLGSVGPKGNTRKGCQTSRDGFRRANSYLGILAAGSETLPGRVKAEGDSSLFLRGLRKKASVSDAEPNVFIRGLPRHAQGPVA